MTHRNHPGAGIFADKSPDELTVEEIHRLLIHRQRAAHGDRLERYRRTGRVVSLTTDVESVPLEGLRTGARAQEAPSRMKTPQWQRARRMDRMLLVVEVGVVAAVLFLVVSNFGMLRKLNREVVRVLDLPTLTPTALIQAVVLPSGHTPPTSPGGSRPNDAEIPPHLRPLAQSLANIPIPTPAPAHALRIQIPAIRVDAPVIQGDGWEQLKKGVAQRIGSANPGERGNMVLSGHNDVFGEIFRDLDQLKTGDEVFLYTQNRAFTYVVLGWQVVEPTRVDLMAPTPDEIVTLISCYPYLVDNKRIVVKAKLVSN